MNPAEPALKDLLPHRGAMLLIDEALEVDARHAVTLSTVHPDWPLMAEKGVKALICVEVAAQSAGVCNGWQRIQERGLDSDKSGWLVAVKRADFFVDVLPLGTVIRTKAENTFSYENFREVTCELHREDNHSLLAKVRLQLYQAG